MPPKDFEMNPKGLFGSFLEYFREKAQDFKSGAETHNAKESFVFPS
jgi:hypothetical protein